MNEHGNGEVGVKGGVKMNVSYLIEFEIMFFFFFLIGNKKNYVYFYLLFF